MKKGTNKTDNYFERVKQRLHPPKYRYYFFDYLYFKGEQWSKKAFRCSGAFILLEYWIMIVAFPAFGFTSVTHHFGDNAVIFYQVLILLLPYIFIFFRYRKDRKKLLSIITDTRKVVEWLWPSSLSSHLSCSFLNYGYSINWNG